MFLPFEIGEIHGALELAYKVIDIGWSRVHDAHQQYLEFKQDIEGLKEQLESLQLTIQISRTRARAQLAPRGQLNQIFDNFKETLEACRQLVESQARHGTQRGPLSNIQWFMLVKDEVDMLRDRIAVLNTKLSLALQSLEIETRDGQTSLMLDLTDLVLRRIELLDSRIARALGEPPPAEPPQRLYVPEPLEEFLEFITKARYGSLTSIPMCQGVDEVVFYLDRATQWHERRHERRESSQQGQAFKWANVFRAYWLLQATKASDEYQAASIAISVAQLEQDLPRLGMTARRFFNKLEEKIVQAHSQLNRSADGTHGAPSSDQLLEIIKQDNTAWQRHEEWKPLQDEDDNPRRGERVATCRLQSPNGEQSLQIYQQAGDQEYLTVITCGPGRPDRIREVDLRCIHLAPSIEAVSPNGGLYSITLNPIKSRSQGEFKLEFQGEEDVFEFQEWMTGYKVVDDYPNTAVSSHRAGVMIGGEGRRDTGRVQLWSSSRLSAGSQLPEELRGPEPSSKASRTAASRTTSLYAPVLNPLASFSRLSLSLQRTGSSSTGSGSVLPEEQTTRVPRPQSGDIPSLTRTSTITSSTSRSSTSSLGGIAKRPTNLIQVDKRGNVGCILDHPDPPRLVIFLPAGKAKKGDTNSGPSLLVIDINQHIRINPTLCDCQHDDTLSRGSSGATAQQQQQGCKKVVLEACGGASGITARETVVNAGWNLAGAGRYQGEGMVGVKRLKKVVLGFGGVEERIRFVADFTDLRELYLSDLRAAAG